MASPSFLLLPGLACDAELFAHQSATLAPHAQVQVSDAHTRAVTLTDMAALLWAEHPGPQVLVGASMGGMLALEMHRQAPQRVAALALLGSTARPDTPELIRLRTKACELFANGRMDEVLRANVLFAFHPNGARAPGLVARYLAMIRRAGATQLVHQNRAVMARVDSRPHLPAIRCPVLVACGEADQLTPPAHAREMAALMPHAQLDLVPGAGHMLTMEQPDRVSALLLRWCKGLGVRVGMTVSMMLAVVLTGVLTGVLTVVAPLAAGPANAQVPPSAAEVAAYSGLHAAAQRGDLVAVARLAAVPAAREARDAQGRTPLHVATFARQRGAVKALMAAGADPAALDSGRYDAVTIAAVADDEDTLRLLLSLGASARLITSRYDGTALIAAAHLGHDGVVRQLIAAQAPLDHVNNLHWTALIEAVVLGDGGARHQATLRALLDAGASTQLADREGRSPLQLARARGYSAMVTMLERAGAR